MRTVRNECAVPGIALVIDSVAEDSVRGIVGVEWHVVIQRLEPDSSGLLHVLCFMELIAKLWQLIQPDPQGLAIN